MTTIATDGRSMAADGQVTRGDHIVSRNNRKIVRTPSGKIVGCCGPSGDDEPFIEWIENGGKKPRLGATFAALVIAQGIAPRIYFNDCTSEPIDGPHAIGSGCQWALAAMDLGKSPLEAVEYAATRDIYTGGEIIVMHIDPPLCAVA